MNIRELDYKGVLPKDREDRTEFAQRGEQFLSDAYGLQDILKSDARGLLARNKLIREKGYQFFRGVKNEACMFVNEKDEFFKNAYGTEPGWVSVIEAELVNKNESGTQIEISQNKSRIPIAIVSPAYARAMDKLLNIYRAELRSAKKRFMNSADLSAFRDLYTHLVSTRLLKKHRDELCPQLYEETKHHEIIHCVRTDLANINFPFPWTMEAIGLLEENLADGLAGRGWNYNSPKTVKKLLGISLPISTLYVAISAGALIAMPTNPLPQLLNLVYGGCILGVAAKGYDSYGHLDSTKTAFREILSGNRISKEPSQEQQDIQYTLLRLKPAEIRKIAKEKIKSDTDSLTAIKNFLGKRKNLRSEIILGNIS